VHLLPPVVLPVLTLQPQPVDLLDPQRQIAILYFRAPALNCRLFSLSSRGAFTMLVGALWST
jgi:hypothetical protein